MSLLTKNIIADTLKTTRFVTKKKTDIGLSPDDISFRGQQKMEKILMRMIDYDGENLREETVDEIAVVLAREEAETVTWFNIDGLHDTKIIEEIATTRTTERGGRADDKRAETAMEDRKKQGYF